MALVQKLRPEEAAIVGAEEASRITTEVVTKILRQHADHAVQQAGHVPRCTGRDSHGEIPKKFELVMSSSPVVKSTIIVICFELLDLLCLLAVLHDSLLRP